MAAEQPKTTFGMYGLEKKLFTVNISRKESQMKEKLVEVEKKRNHLDAKYRDDMTEFVTDMQTLLKQFLQWTEAMQQSSIIEYNEKMNQMEQALLDHTTREQKVLGMMHQVQRALGSSFM